MKENKNTTTNQSQRQKTDSAYEEWVAGFEGLSFMERAIKIKDKLFESPELSTEDKQMFDICFEYVAELYQKEKPLETNLLKIRLQMKGYNTEQHMEQFIRTLMLLSICGFQFDYAGQTLAQFKK